LLIIIDTYGSQSYKHRQDKLQSELISLVKETAKFAKV